LFDSKSAITTIKSTVMPPNKKSHQISKRKSRSIKLMKTFLPKKSLQKFQQRQIFMTTLRWLLRNTRQDLSWLR